MIVTVRLVGHLARKLGREVETELPEGATFGAAVQEIFRRFSLGDLDLNSGSSTHGFLTILLNGRKQSFDVNVKEGDQIALLPPLAGG